MDNQLLEKKLSELPEDLKKEALDFIDFLIVKNNQDLKKEKFNFSWEGGLSELKDKYSSVTLQHDSMGWRK